MDASVLEASVIDNIRRWRAKPQAMVRELFGATPDIWQDEVLEAFPHKQRIALLASKGVGKTTLLAWVTWNFLLTRPDCKIAAVSTTGANLADNFWTEMAVWQAKSPLLTKLFEWKKTRIEARQNPSKWYLSARSWPQNGSPQEQAGALQGLHAEYVMAVLDESGDIPEAVLATVEAALSTCIEGHIIQAGNPSKREGALYKAHTTRDQWHVVSINSDPDNPKRSRLVSVDWARDQIAAFGRDSAWTKVNVFGEFPLASLNALIGPEEIEAACKRSHRPEDIARSPKILGVDVAFEGADASVIWPRQGLVAFPPRTYRNLDGIQGASIVSTKWDEWEADACFIDATGGFGLSWIDNLRLLGKSPIGVKFSEKPINPGFANKRAEIYWNCAQWIKDGGQLPPMSTPGMNEFMRAMISTTYTDAKDRLILEPKELVKQKINCSPDHADSLALSFAAPITARQSSRPHASRHRSNWDLNDAMDEQTKNYGSRNHRVEWNMFG